MISLINVDLKDSQPTLGISTEGVCAGAYERERQGFLPEQSLRCLFQLKP